MKLHLKPNLDYLLQAMESMGELFRGQEIYRAEFAVAKSMVVGALLPGRETDLGVGNAQLTRRRATEPRLGCTGGGGRRRGASTLCSRPKPACSRTTSGL